MESPQGEHITLLIDQVLAAFIHLMLKECIGYEFNEDNNRSIVVTYPPYAGSEAR